MKISNEVIHMEKFNYLEEKLRKRLKPYQPKPEFVAGLKRKITEMPSIEMEYPRTRAEVYITAAAVVSGTVFIMLLIKKLTQK
jgi:hypothetical protein